MTHLRLRLPLLLLLAWLAGCAPYPRDPQHTTQRVTDGVMRVGVIHDPPFVRLRDGAPEGREVEMVRALADSLDARVQWVDGGTYELFEALRHFRLDLIIGGIPPKTPWKPHVGLTSPYTVRDRHGWLLQRVTAVPPGENRWLMQVERFQGSPQAKSILGGAGTPAARPAQAATRAAANAR